MKNNDFKDKVLKGVSWSFLEQIITYLSVFIFGIILARLITPEEFGLVGIIGIFLGVLPLFVDGGFASALKQSKECNDKDFSTVFYFNLFMSIVLYIILFFSSQYIAQYFSNIRLIALIRVLGLNLILSSLFSIQVVILSRKLNFKIIAKVNSISQIISGLVAIVFAFLDYGVWALVIRTICQSIITIFLYYKFSKWKPIFYFNLKILKKLFSYGSYLFLGSFINVLFKNAFTFVIGKYYSPTQLGYYTRANNFSMLPSQNLTMIVQKVAFPAFSKIQDDKIRLLSINRKTMKVLMFISSLLLIGLAACSKFFVLSLIGEKWENSIVYLQILCFVSVFYPANSINVNIMNVVGKSNLSLKLVYAKNILMIPVILIGIKHNILYMLYAMLAYSIIVFFLNMTFVNKLIGYTLKMQLQDILPSFIFSSFIGLVVYFFPFLYESDKYTVTLLLQLFLGFFVTICLGEIISYKPYTELKMNLKVFVIGPIKNKLL